MKEQGFSPQQAAELIVQTRPAHLARDPDNFIEELTTAMEADVDAIFAEDLAPEEIVAECAAEEAYNEEIRGRPEILQTRFPRMRGKQPPKEGWQSYPVDPVVQQRLKELAAEDEASEEDAEEQDSDGPGEVEEDEDPTEPAEPPRKKPARRPGDKTCPGRSPEQPCQFTQSVGRLGSAALLKKGKDKCLFCDPEVLEAAVKEPQKKKHLTRALRNWTEAGREDIVAAAMALLPEGAEVSVRHALARPSRAAAAVKARAEEQAQARKDTLQKMLDQRQHLGSEPSEEERRIYQKKIADDKRRLRRKFAPLVAAAEEQDTSWQSPLAERFEAWCRETSWVACEKCHRLEKKPLREADISGRRARPASIHKCSHCQKGVGYPTVAFHDIPEELRRLSDNALWALRPLEPDVGPLAWATHGFRVHTDMIRFWWRARSVIEQLAMLEDEEEKVAAKRAYEYLMAQNDSSYRKFVDMQKKFLRKYGAHLESEWDRKLQLPRTALEEEGLECAIWPHLYPRTNMCETYIRKQDVRRKERAVAVAPAPAERRPRRSSSQSSSSTTSTSSTSSSSPSASAVAQLQPKREGQAEEQKSDNEAEDVPMESDEEPDQETDTEDEDDAVAPLDFARPGRNSAKSAYLAKVLGPVLGYGATYELFQFVYDLWLWSTLGAKKNTVDAPMRISMAGYSFSPEYWHERHAALVDTVKQLGLPTAFITIAPYEWSFPYHAWVEDEAKKLLRAKLQLPVAETLHIAHALTEAVVGLLTGANQSTAAHNRKPWSSHIFAAKDGSGRQTVVNFFGRLEYQDGKRKRYVNHQEVASQFYHGRGTVHLHLLVWLQHLDAVKLEDSISATVPEDNEVMASLVEGSQRSWTGSGWPKQEGPSHLDPNTGRLHLHHSETDFCKYKADGTAEGVRAYLKDILASLHCHVDVQMSDGRYLLLKYVSGYVPKFSDSFTTDWLCDQGSDYAISKRVLTDYHPLVPEMTLQLAMRWFPQCFAGGSLQPFRVPVPWEKELPDRVKQYMTCRWRPADMPLVEFLRKTSKKGNIHKKLEQRYKQAKQAAEAAGEELMEESLEAWAVNAEPQGEVALAAKYLSRYNDRYYGQWVLMNAPFRDLDAELKKPELELVPDHLYYQALAYLHRPDHWANPDAIRAELELEAFREYHIRNILAMLAANQSLIKKYLDGTLDKNDDLPEDVADPLVAAGAAGLALSLEQKRIADEIVESVKEGICRRHATENAWKGEGPEQEDPFAQVTNLRSAFAVLGPAGSGKTTAVHQVIRDVAVHEGRILLAAPTGRLAATMREKFPDLEVDTVHGAFLVYKPVQERVPTGWLKVMLALLHYDKFPERIRLNLEFIGFVLSM